MSRLRSLAPFAALAALAAWPAASPATEGMWLPEQVPQLGDRMRSDGLALDPSALTDLGGAPLGAIVSLGFCSGSFVSAQGLVITNHHCAEGFLALQSTGGTDLLAKGFTAAQRGAELPAGPGARLYVLEDITDVTDKVRAAVPADAPDLDRQRALDRVRSQLTAECEKQAGRRCRVAEFDAGLRYRLYRSLEIRDVRIVHAPPANVGFFGGDADNFEWPRHDGDYALLRAYVGPKGEPADPSPKNVPYAPRHVLPIQTAGVAPGDFVMVAGFPGRTERYALYDDLEFQTRVSLPEDLADAAWYESLILGEMERDPSSTPWLQSTLFGLQNGRKYDEGIRDNVASSPVLARKAELAAQVDAWIAADPSRATTYGASITELRRLLHDDHAHHPLDRAIGELMSCTLLDVAHTGLRWAQERAKPEIDREAGYKDRDKAEIAAWFTELQESWWEPVERAACAHAIDAVVHLPSDQRINVIDVAVAKAGSVDALVRDLFTDDSLKTPKGRTDLLKVDAKSFAASPNAWIRLASALESDVLAPMRERDKANAGAWRRHYPRWVEAVQAVQGGLAYPDANSTLRLTWGKVEGYPVADGLLATPQTTLRGLLAKHATPTYEAPAWLVQAAPSAASSRWFDPRLGDLPVDFLSSVDTTGGNSGSATLNAKGELVGLLFDGNYESMAADWLFEPTTTRSIHVDVRYILWLMSLDPATAWIFTELGLPR
jgi:hypothetical protein